MMGPNRRAQERESAAAEAAAKAKRAEAERKAVADAHKIAAIWNVRGYRSPVRAQLNGAAAPTRKQPVEVTDPMLLGRLNAGAPARESSWGDYVGPALVGLIGTGSAIAAARHGRLPRNPAPTTQQLEQAVTGGYDALRGLGVEFEI
jgi:hypothetical protein